MHVLGLCINLNSFVEHMLYAWSFSYNTELPISIKHKIHILSLNTILCLIGELVLQIKIEHNNYIHLYEKMKLIQFKSNPKIHPCNHKRFLAFLYCVSSHQCIRCVQIIKW